MRVLQEVGGFFLGEAVGKFMFLGFHGRPLFVVFGGLVLIDWIRIFWIVRLVLAAQTPYQSRDRKQ